MALQDILEKVPILLSSIMKLDEVFGLNRYKGKHVPSKANRNARKHEAKAAKRGIPSEYIANCTGIQRNRRAVAETANRAKPSGREPCKIFNTHIFEDTLVLKDGLRSYINLKAATGCTVVDVNHEESKKLFNLNMVNSLHSYIKKTYNQYRGGATKYIYL